jgi:hypothetical protein
VRVAPMDGIFFPLLLDVPALFSPPCSPRPDKGRTLEDDGCVQHLRMEFSSPFPATNCLVLPTRRRVASWRMMGGVAPADDPHLSPYTRDAG